MCKYTVVRLIPTTTVILNRCVVGIPLFTNGLSLKKQNTNNHHNTKKWSTSVFNIINVGLPTTHLINPYVHMALQIDSIRFM